MERKHIYIYDSMQYFLKPCSVWKIGKKNNWNFSYRIKWRNSLSHSHTTNSWYLFVLNKNWRFITQGLGVYALFGGLFLSISLFFFHFWLPLTRLRIIHAFRCTHIIPIMVNFVTLIEFLLRYKCDTFTYVLCHLIHWICIYTQNPIHLNRIYGMFTFSLDWTSKKRQKKKQSEIKPWV